MARTGRTYLRRGSSSQAVLALVVAISALPLLGWLWLENWWGGAATDGPLTCTPIRGTFIHEIVEKGTLECASNVEVKCGVDVSGFYSTEILEVVPEGTSVQPGDFLIQLDSSPLEELFLRRTILCNQYQAALTQTESWLQTCRYNLDEYVHGLFPQGQQRLADSLARAEENLRQATQTFHFSESMYRRGFITQISLEADEYAMQRAQIEADTARKKLEVLENFRSKKRLNDLESSLAVAEASVRWRRHVLDLSLKELKKIEQQIGNCRVTAPTAGQVVYAHIHHNGHSHLIEPGAFVWRDRVLILLPNSAEMHVKVQIPEIKVAHVRSGQKVRIRFEAFPGAELIGKVRLVDEFPSPTDYWGPQIKSYETTVSIDRSSIEAASLDLRPGLTAELFIEVDEQAQCMMVPSQAVLRQGAKSYCITHGRGGFQAHEVKTGGTNGKFVVIREGLEEGQAIVLGASKYRKEVELPPLEEVGRLAQR